VLLAFSVDMSRGLRGVDGVLARGRGSVLLSKMTFARGGGTNETIPF